MKSYPDQKVNGVPLSPVADTNPAIDAIAQSAVKRELRRAAKLSVMANAPAIHDAVDRAVRLALQSFGINA